MIERLELEISRACGLRCVHCSVRASPRVGQPELSYEEWAKVIDDFAAMGGREVVITGGEPLLHKDIFRLLEHVKSKHLIVKLYTAGYLVTPEAARHLSAVDIVCVSLEGGPLTHELVTGVPRSYSLTLQGIEMLRRYGANVRLHFTSMKANFRELAHVVQVAENIGAESVKVLKFAPEGRGLDNRRSLSLSLDEQAEFEELLRKIRIKTSIPIKYGGQIVPGTRCGVGNKLLITSDGYAIPCLGLRDQTVFRLGNVKYASLSQICTTLKSAISGECLCEVTHKILAE